MGENRYSIICAVNKPKVFEENLFMSPGIFHHELIVKSDYTNICKAYNDAIEVATSDILIFVHQDVYFPRIFFDQLKKSLDKLSTTCWGVLGPAGRNRLGEMKGHILDRGHMWGTCVDLPTPVQTLDELCLITKKEIFDKISFDEAIPNQHLFGSDICMQALELGFSNWAIDAFCYHNSNSGHELPGAFWEVASYLRDKWKHKIPIYSTCAVIE